jgi:hypothetical protein
MPGDMESRQVSQGSVVDRGTLVTPKNQVAAYRKY